MGVHFGAAGQTTGGIMKICQGCKQQIRDGERYEASAAPNGATWYLHTWIGDCVRAMLARKKKARAA